MGNFPPAPRTEGASERELATAFLRTFSAQPFFDAVLRVPLRSTLGYPLLRVPRLFRNPQLKNLCPGRLSVAPGHSFRYPRSAFQKRISETLATADLKPVTCDLQLGTIPR
jgi:hypothetical protein